MDSKIFQKTLPDDPSEEDYLYWKRMLQIYITKAEVPEDSKLDVLLVLCGSKAFSLVEDCEDYETAISRMEGKYLKRSTAIMMRHKLLSRKQQSTESVEDYMGALKALAKKCHTTAMTAEEHKRPSHYGRICVWSQFRNDSSTPSRIFGRVVGRTVQNCFDNGVGDSGF